MKLLSILFLFTIASLAADSPKYLFYLKVDSGISCSTTAAITAPSPPWNEAIQGYNANLGTCPIIGLSVGCEFLETLDLEVGMSNRSTFEYRKFQTSTTSQDSYTRQFDLSVTPLLFSINLQGKGIPYLHLDLGLNKFYPTIGAGFGVSNLLITNFRTTGLPPSGNSSPYASFSAENQYTLRRNFTYTLLAGVEYSYKSLFAIGTGYRWLDAGQFNGPRYQRVSSGSAVDVGSDSWKIRFKANEWFVTFKIFI